ncbi:MAG: DUF4446 family protein [Defluviitaleaceae bacterium]|nr:DUF4446 family protein [Defluviitaleaceae bacterium]
MPGFYNIIAEYSPHITIALIVAVAVLFAMVIIITYILSKQNDRMYRFFGGRTKRRSMEAMLDEYLDKVERVEGKYDGILSLIDDINLRMVTCLRNVGVVRYNPFDDMGGDMSFAVALLDENDDGVVISTIHAREASYTYAKQILGGKASHMLTEEEQEAIRVALEGKPLVDMGVHKVKRDRRLADLPRHQRKLDALHEANAPDPMETPKGRMPSKAKAKIKASRKRIFGKNLAQNVKEASEEIRQFHEEDFAGQMKFDDIEQEIRAQDTLPENLSIELKAEADANITTTDDGETAEVFTLEEQGASDEDLEEIMENQRAIERLRQKLLDHKKQQENEGDKEVQ